MYTDYPCSSDIVGLNVYFSSSSTWKASATNISLYISATPVWRNGTLCADNFTPTQFDFSANFIACPGISNAQYITLQRWFTDRFNGFLALTELEILRSGAAPEGTAGDVSLQ